LVVYSNNPVQLTQLPESRNAVYIGKWEELSAGGCHLNEFPYEKDPSKRTWTSNPKYLLQFKEEGPVNLKVTLQVAEKNWKSKIAKLNKVVQSTKKINVIEHNWRNDWYICS